MNSTLGARHSYPRVSDDQSSSHRRRGGLVAMLLLIGLVVFSVASADAYCPKTDILSETFSKTCWECTFPLSLIGMTVMNISEDGVVPALGPGLAPDFPPQLCGCICLLPGVCIPGLPLGVFLPTHLIEVVRNPLCFPSLNGISLGADPTFINRGLAKANGDEIDHNFSYYHAHFIIFPLWALLGPGFDIACTNPFSSGNALDIAYLSELDPMWDDDTLSTMMFPEAFLLANPAATAACSVDSVASAVSWPIDELFWCAGSFGNIYPPTGFVGGAWSGQVKPAALILTRLLAKLARTGTELYWAAHMELICTDIPTFLIVKSQYKFQLLYPIPNTSLDGGACCSPLGRTQLRWGLAKTYPVDGDDFVFLLWKLQRCCLL